MAVLAGCNALFGLDEPGSRPDATPTVEDGRLCWGTDLAICLTRPPAEPVMLSGALDTSTSLHCRPEISAACVVAGTMVSLPSGTTLVATGLRPLVLLASEELVVDGTLDAASHVATLVGGPGALAATCNPPLAMPSRHGGGAGGSFAAAGGAGAGNDSPGSDTGGAAASPLAAIAFRAGCRGQNAGATSGTFGFGGPGGGAAYLIGGTRITIHGTVNASGGAGRGGQCTPAPCSSLSGQDANGGGGGGSGGMLVLDAPAVAIPIGGRVLAEGGGGGEGASVSEDGVDGGEATDGIIAASGGTGPAGHGGDGGAGAHTTILVGGPGERGTSSNPGGGGGGGGGAGVIRLRQATAIEGGGVVSPPAR